MQVVGIGIPYLGYTYIWILHLGDLGGLRMPIYRTLSWPDPDLLVRILRILILS